MTTLPAVVVVLWTILAAAFGAPHTWMQDGGVFTEYPVAGGSPYRICAQTSETVWFTMPAQNMLGRLTLTPSARIDSFPLPHAGSHPYDIACAGGLVWLTELAGNRIAQFNPVTSNWVEYPINTLASQPTGLDVQPGDPTEVWFVERAGNKVGRLVVPAAGAATLTEYLSPRAGTQFEDISLTGTGIAWFTAPGTNEIGRFNLTSQQQFAFEYTGPGSEPWNIDVQKDLADPRPWFTDRAGNRIGRFDPGTLITLRWVNLPTPGSNPYAIALAAGRVWFTEQTGQRVGWVAPSLAEVEELPLPGSSFTGLSFDDNDCGWLADNAQNRLVRWCAPYARSIYLPLMQR